jgi:outer membrane protein
MVNSDVTIFKGLQKQNTIKKNKFDMMAQLNKVEEAKHDMKMNVVTYYLNVLSNKEQKRIKEEQLKVTLDQIDKTKQQVEVGNKAKGDLLEIKAQAAKERVELTDARNQLRMSKINLIQLMNLDSLNGFDIETPSDLTVEETEQLMSTESIYDESVKEFPTIKNAEYLLKSSEKNLAIMKGMRYPELSLGLQVQTRYNELSTEIFPYRTQLEENAFVVAQLSLNIPIFDRMNIKNNIDNARLTVKDSRYQLKEFKQNLYKNIQRARNEAISAYENYQSNKEAVKSMEEAFEYTKEKYNVGLVDVIDYRIAKNNLTEARSNLSNAKYNYIFRLKLLEFYMGQQMDL